MAKRTRKASLLWIIIPLLLAAMAGYVWTRLLADTPPALAEAAAPDRAVNAAGQRGPDPKTDANLPKAPPQLSAQIASLGKGFDGDVGIVVQSVENDWITQHGGDQLLPQQSLSKLWVAATIMDRIDNGEVTLDERITLTASDLSIFHQPIRKKILARGAYQTSIAELLRYAMTQSDNTANAALFRRAGGRDGILRFLSEKKLGAINMAQNEKALQMSIVGMEWQDRFSYGRNFWQAREKIPFANRMQTMGRYLTEPPDGATPLAMADGLARLARGELLSAQSSAYLIDLMARSKTGPKRLRGGLQEGWSLPHKTGTGQVLKLLATAYNDIGILISPTGRRYVVVVMIGATNRPVPERQDLMQAVTRAVIAHEDSQTEE